MTHRVKAHKEFLRALHCLKPKYRKVLLGACNKEEIDCICECIYNVLKGKIPLQDEHKNKLDKYKNVLRKLVSKTKNKARKNIIIQKGGTFLPIILSTVLGALFNSLI